MRAMTTADAASQGSPNHQALAPPSGPHQRGNHWSGKELSPLSSTTTAPRKPAVNRPWNSSWTWMRQSRSYGSSAQAIP